jgi:cell division protein FtsB
MAQLAELDPVLINPLRQPEERPQKRTAPVPKARPAVIRMAVAMVLGALCFTFAGRLAAFAVEPAMATYRTGQEIRTLEGELKQEEARHEALKDDLRYLRSKRGVEQEARQQGYVMPGEIALNLPPAPSTAQPGTTTPGAGSTMPAKSAAPPAAATAPNSGSTAIADQIRAAVETCLAVFGHRPRGR